MAIASSISGNLDPYGRPIVDKKTTQVQQPTVANPIVPPVQQVATQTPVQQVNTPTQTTTPQTQAFVPEPVKIDQSFIAFGDSARQRNEQDQTYLTTRNNMLAQGFASQNVVDEQQILNKLQSMSNFNTQPIEDQQNTAKSIASMIQQMQTGQQPTPEQPGQQQQGPSMEEVLDRSLQNTIENEQQAFLQDVYRSGTIYDRNKEDLENQNRIIQRNLERQAEDTRIGVERQIDDIILQTQRGVEGYEMVGALKGFNRGSGFIAGLVNIKDDANRTISRLQQDLSRYMDATGEAKAEALKQLNTGMTRAKEDFEYAMRDVMQLAQIDLNTITNQYGLDPTKMGARLDAITDDVLQRRANLVSTYIANTRNTIQAANDQMTTIERYTEYVGQQRERFTSILDANDGAALSSMTPAMIQEYVSQGYLAPEQGVAYFELMKGKSIATLQANGKPTNEDVTQVMSLIDGGMTPAEAVAKVMQDNPDRYEAGAERQVLPGGGGALRRVGADGKPEIFQGPQDQGDWKQSPDGTWYRTNQSNAPVSPTQGQPSGYYSKFRITQDYGDKSPNPADDLPLANGQRGTPGIDLAMPVGSEVISTVSGKVTSVGEKGDYGNQIVITDAEGNKHMFSHLSNINVNVGQEVDMGVSIGLSGNTGFSTGPHLDYRVKNTQGQWADPKQWMQQQSDGPTMKDMILSAIRSGTVTPSAMADYREQALREGRAEDIIKAEGSKYDGALVKDLKESIIKQSGYTDMQDIARGYNTVTGIYSKGVDKANGMDDISAVNALQRMIDPGATVREGDVELIQSAIPYFKRIDPTFQWNKLNEGVILPADTRRKLIETAESVYKAQSDGYNQWARNLYAKDFEKAGSNIEESGLLFTGKSNQPTTTNNTQVDISKYTDRFRN